MKGKRYKFRIVLFLIVIIELLLVTTVLLWGYRWFNQKKAIEASKKITVIDKNNLNFPDNPEFQYYYVHDPDVVETVQPDWLTYSVTYTFNADGFNERFDYQVEKPENILRIMTLGDSFTFGQYVNTSENWSEQLEDLLNQDLSACLDKKVEVINLGMPGHDVPYLLKRFKDFGAKYQPDLIVWFESGTGFTRYMEEMLPMVKSCEAEQEAKGITPEQGLLYYECWGLSNDQLIEKYSASGLGNFLKKYLDEFFTVIDQNKLFYFTFDLENFNQDSQEIFSSWRGSYPEANFIASVPILAGTDGLLADGHPSPSGHKIIARAIADYLKEDLFIQCKQ